MSEGTPAKSLRGARTEEELLGLRTLILYWDEVKHILEKGYREDGPAPTLEQILAGDNAKLVREIEELINGVNKNILNHLEVALCEGAEHKELFAKLRTVVLRSTNDAIRELPKRLVNYHALQYQESKTVVIKPQGAASKV